MTAAAAASPARPRRRWIWASVAIVTAVVLVVPVAFRIGLKGEIRHEVVPVTVFQRSVDEVEVDAPGQSVTIVRGRPGQVRVVSSMSWLLGRPTFRHAWYGRTLQVTAGCATFNVFEDCQASLLIRVPANVTVRVAVGSGSAAVAGLTGPVHLTATSGSIRLTDVSGPVWAMATTGSIVATNGLTSRQVDAGVGSGSLALDFAAAPAAVALDVGSGSGRVTVPPGARYRISGERASGVLQIGSGLIDSRAARVITATVGSGHLAIDYLRPVSPGAARVTGAPRVASAAGKLTTDTVRTAQSTSASCTV